MIGKSLSQYIIESSLGAGGMGEVYRARDTRLGRSVAVKVLPEMFAQNAERIARFEREAKLLAALNHGNVATLFGLEQFEGRHFLVMELVEGETLAERIARGPIAVDDVLRIAHQIAEALEAAHEKGIVHRDLKPANVKMTPEGKVKVLDFGLAKAMETPSANPATSNSPTLSLGATNAGVILGTAAYMAPEQAKGLDADPRSDIFSFGCILYEMLTGRQPFKGDTVAEILASVLAREPDFSMLPPNLNPRIQVLLRRCLEKDPKKRWHAAADTRVEIDALLADPRGVLVQPQRTVMLKPLWKRAMPVVFALFAGAAMAGGAAWYLRPAPAMRIVTRFSFALPETQQFTNMGRQLLAISPDGTHFVYVANFRLYLKSMQEMSSYAIPGIDTGQGVTNPVFSPDGRSIAFWSISDSAFKRVSVSGGAPVTICEGDNPFGMSWGQDNQLVIGQGSKGIIRVSADGGKPETIVKVNGAELAHGPQILPGGRAVLFTVAGNTSGSDLRWLKAKIVVQVIQSGERKTLIESGTDARYVPTGHIVYTLSGTLLAVPFDVKRLELTGGPVPVLEGVRPADNGTTGTSQFSYSENGSLVFIPGDAAGRLAPVLIDRNGVAKTIAIPPGPYDGPRISPNGKQLAIASNDGKEAMISIYDLSGGASMRRLTFGGKNRFPIWSGDGQRILFQSDRENDSGLFWQRADGSGSAERVTRPEEGVQEIPDAWSPKDQIFSFISNRIGSDGALWTYSIPDKKGTLFYTVSNSWQERSVFSPDGKWLAYQSQETGLMEVYVQPFPPTGARFQITRGTGAANHHPVWSPDGKEIFFVNAMRLYSVAVQTQPSFTFANPVALPISGIQPNPGGSREFDITPDGKQFIALVPAGQTAADPRSGLQIRVVLNWFEELKQRSAAKIR
jgi:Tol biopolymer transport system component/predicted Ser/Thr protein kinase